ncbi:MAG: ATP-binding protein [Acutalibacteraceae bacterium]
MEYIKRKIEDKLITASKTFKAVLLTGARQVGKSTVLKSKFPDYKYVSLDDPFLEEQAKTSGEMFLSLNQPPVTLDEVQRAPELFRYIKIACDESDQRGLFLLLGSQQFKLRQDASDSLSGRVCIVELSGLSLREIMNDPFNERFVPTVEYVKERSKTAKAPKNIWEIIHRGSYPELQDENVSWSDFYASYVKTYLERDVRELSAVHDLDVFRRFMIATAARTGEILNYSNIASEVGKDVTTIKNWISILETSGIIYLLKPYTASVLNRAIKTPKLYFRDTGLASYLTRWLTPEALAYGAMSGHMFETFVISEILKSFSNAGIDYRYCVSYYRGKDKKKQVRNGEEAFVESEIDFIIEENGVLYPVEIKQNNNVTDDETSAFTVLDKIPDKKRGTGAIVCMCPQPGTLRDNVLQIPVWYI